MSSYARRRRLPWPSYEVQDPEPDEDGAFCSASSCDTMVKPPTESDKYLYSDLPCPNSPLRAEPTISFSWSTCINWRRSSASIHSWTSHTLCFTDREVESPFSQLPVSQGNLQRNAEEVEQGQRQHRIDTICLAERKRIYSRWQLQRHRRGGTGRSAFSNQWIREQRCPLRYRVRNREGWIALAGRCQQAFAGHQHWHHKLGLPGGSALPSSWSPEPESGTWKPKPTTQNTLRRLSAHQRKAFRLMQAQQQRPVQAQAKVVLSRCLHKVQGYQLRRENLLPEDF